MKNDKRYYRILANSEFMFFIYICVLIDLNPDYAIQIYEKVKKTARHFTQDENQRHFITYLSR